MDKTLLGKRIIQARENLGLRQAQAARLLNMPREMLCRYESGEKTPSVMQLVRIANGLEISPNALLRDYLNP